MRKSASVLFFFVCACIAAACSSSEPEGGPCQSDNDCKGDRVCNGGACVDPSEAGSVGASSSGMSSSSGAGSGGAGGGAGSGGAEGGSGGGGGASGPDATWHDLSAMSGIWQARKPLQSMASCETQPPIGEYVQMTIAAMHGGSAVGEYMYCNPEGGGFTTQRCFEAMRMVGPTGIDIAADGDTLELVSHDEAAGLSSGVLTTAKHGTYMFQATHCK